MTDPTAVPALPMRRDRLLGARLGEIVRSLPATGFNGVMAFVPQDRPRLGRLAGICEAYLIAAAQADLAPPVAEAVTIEVRAAARVGRRGARGQGQLQAAQRESQGRALDRPRDPFKTKELSARNRQSSRRTEAMPRGGIRSTSFKPGVSGNPGGRPKTPQTIEVRRIILGAREAARELTLDAIDTLAAIMKDPKAPAAARISAAVALLDRGHGRPNQAVDVNVGVDLGLLSDEELYTLDAILSRASVPAPDPSGRYLT